MNIKDENSSSDPDLDNEELVDALQDDDTPENPPEVSEETEDLTTWDEPSDSAGHVVPRVPLDDEISPVEQMVNEGLEEADHDIRVAAAAPDLDL